jgi:hypothetical protein
LTIGLGLKDLLARGCRALLLAAAIALTCAVVTALPLDATLDAQPASEASDFPDELLLLIYALDTVVLLITTTTLVAVALPRSASASAASASSRQSVSRPV